MKTFQTIDQHAFIPVETPFLSPACTSMICRIYRGCAISNPDVETSSQHLKAGTHRTRKKLIADDPDVALVPDACTNTFLKTLALDTSAFANLLRISQISNIASLDILNTYI